MEIFKGVAVVDVEATGLDSRRCSIISVGIVFFSNGLREHYFECRPFRGAVIQNRAFQITGMTRKRLFLKGRGSLRSLMKNTISVLKGNSIHMIAGQNTSFDRDWLVSAAKRCKMNWSFGHRVIDMHSIAYSILERNGMRIPKEPDGSFDISATNIYKMLGMPTEPKPHNALNGAKYEFEALCRLVYGRSVVPEFKLYPVIKIPS